MPIDSFFNSLSIYYFSFLIERFLIFQFRGSLHPGNLWLLIIKLCHNYLKMDMDPKIVPYLSSIPWLFDEGCLPPSQGYGGGLYIFWQHTFSLCMIGLYCKNNQNIIEIKQFSMNKPVRVHIPWPPTSETGRNPPVFRQRDWVARCHFLFAGIVVVVFS